MSAVETLDLVLVLIAIAGAASALVWTVAFRKKQPACHPSTQPEGGDVVIGGALARGVERAKQRRERKLGRDE